MRANQQLFRVGPEAVEKGVAQQLLGCPFVFVNGRICRLANEFLRDLYLGSWPTSDAIETDGSHGQRRKYRWMESSVEKAGQNIIDFARWCATPEMHLTANPPTLDSFTEEDVDRYADQMQSGIWSTDGRGLGLSTIATRQKTAIEFSFWHARLQNLPAPSYRITVAKRRISASSGGQRMVSTKRFAVVRRPDPATLTFPTVEEVQAHLSACQHVGVSLATKLIYYCGLRRVEVCNLQLDDLNRYRAGKQNFIRVVGKGNKTRKVEIDDGLLRELNDYVSSERLIVLRKFKTKSNNVLINHRTGRAFGPRTIWTTFKVIPSIYNSPHLGRHWYSMHYMLKAWKSENARIARSGLMARIETMNSSMSLHLIRLSQNLGHASVTTTQKYLVALAQYIEIDEMYLDFQNYISGELSEC